MNTAAGRLALSPSRGGSRARRQPRLPRPPHPPRAPHRPPRTPTAHPSPRARPLARRTRDHDAPERAALMRQASGCVAAPDLRSDDHSNGRAPRSRPRPWHQEVSPDARRAYASTARTTHAHRNHRAARTELHPPQRATAPASPATRRRCGASATGRSSGRRSRRSAPRRRGGRTRASPYGSGRCRRRHRRRCGRRGRRGTRARSKGWVRTRSGDEYKPSALRGYEQAMRTAGPARDRRRPPHRTHSRRPAGPRRPLARERPRPVHDPQHPDAAASDVPTCV